MQRGVDDLEFSIDETPDGIWYIRGRIGRRNIRGGAWPKDENNFEGCIFDCAEIDLETNPRFIEGSFEDTHKGDRLHFRWIEDGNGEEGEVLTLTRRAIASESSHNIYQRMRLGLGGDIVAGTALSLRLW